MVSRPKNGAPNHPVFNEHLVDGSSRSSWANDPFISTISDIDVARGFNQSGSNLRIIEIV